MRQNSWTHVTDQDSWPKKYDREKEGFALSVSCLISVREGSYRIQVQCIPVQVQELSFHVPYCPMKCAWILPYLPMEKKVNFILSTDCRTLLQCFIDDDHKCKPSPKICRNM